MSSNSLSATTNSGSQTTTQDPQTASQSPAAANSARQSSVQPGTATTLLDNGNGGEPLHRSPLSTVSLNSVATTTPSTAAQSAVPAKHHINPVLFGFSGLLLVVAVVLVWTTSRSVKSTT